jgi:5'-3' exonuclease
MPAAIDTEVKKKVINQWLIGDTRDKIAADNKIGAGTVSNIINQWKKGVENSDYESIRELSLFSKKHGLNLAEYACSIRLNNYIVNIGTNPDEIESFIANLANSPEPEKLIDVANQIAGVSRSESIPLEDLETHVKQREKEIQRLEEEIKQRRAILESTNVDVQTISEYTHLKEELNQYRLSTEDPTRLLLLLQTIKQIGYEPQKIVARFSNIESLRQTEKGLKDNCKNLRNALLDA